jgi:phosphoglycerate dehydrogenase-like enzyme
MRTSVNSARSLPYWETLLRESDFITLHAPLTPETRGLLNRERLARTKPGVRIINCARGELIDADALAEFIESGMWRARRSMCSPPSRRLPT